MGACWSRAKEEFSTNAKSMGVSMGITDEHDCIEAIVLQRKAVGQQHLFNSFDKLTKHKKEENSKQIKRYLKQIESIDFEQINTLFEKLYNNTTSTIDPNKLERVNNSFSLVEGKTEEQKQHQAEQQEEYFYEGLLQIAMGKVAVVISAGGQATRLGTDVPKGAFDLQIQDYEESSLFHIFANKIESLERCARQQFPQRIKHNAKDLIHLFIMTSSANDKETKEYFEKHKNFGLSKAQVHFFMQDDMPALDNKGKIMLKEEFDIHMSPSGNGGFYDAFETQLPKLREFGIEYFHIVSVDNILNKLADPVMIGYAYKNSIEFISKFVKKIDPLERVGLFVEYDQQLNVIEYSELSEKQRYAKKGDDLKFNQAFLAQFLMKTTLFEELVKSQDPVRRKKRIDAAKQRALDLGMSEQEVSQKFGTCTEESKEAQTETIIQDNQKGWRQFHIAKKSIYPYYNQEEDKIIDQSDGQEINGVKFEQFIHDSFPQILSYNLQEVIREDEFAPIKNREIDPKTQEKIPNDNRRTALELQSILHMRWLKRAGYRFAENLVPDGEKNIVFVDPRLSYFGEGIFDGKNHPIITELPFILKCNLKPKVTSDSIMSQLF